MLVEEWPTPKCRRSFRCVRERRKSAPLANGVQAVAAAGEHFVWISLVADVPHQPVLGRIEYVVQRHREFHHTQARGEMAADVADGLDLEGPQLIHHFLQVAFRERAQVGRRVDMRKQRIVG